MKRLANIIKYFKFVYSIYYYVFNFLLRFLKLFVKEDEKLILFNSFGGRKYDDSPKVIFEAMQKDPRFQGYKMVWAFHAPEGREIPGAVCIKTDSLKYFITALKARAWITNSSVERGLNFKGKNTFYFNTWHGTPIKKMGTDMGKENSSFHKKGEFRVDVMMAQSNFEADIFSRVFGIPRENFLLGGLPRNDRLASYTEEERAAVREKLGIPKDKIAILYAPTFREYTKDRARGCVLKPPMDLAKWEDTLSETHCLLFRAHYEVAKSMDFTENDFIRDMTAYPCLEDLLIAADILISDYSSIFFDFSIMDKAMLHFTYDYGEYAEKRGMYFDIRTHLSGSDTEDGVLDILLHMDREEEKKRAKAFQSHYVNFYGNATEEALSCIFQNIGGAYEE